MQFQSPEWFLHGSPWVPVCDVTTINLYLELIKPAIVQLGLLSDSGQRRFLRGEISTHATRRVWIWQLYWRYVGEHESGLNRGKELDGIGWCAWLKWVAWSDELGMNCKQHQVVAEPPNRGVVYWGCAMTSRWLFSGSCLLKHTLFILVRSFIVSSWTPKQVDTNGLLPIGPCFHMKDAASL